MKYIRSTTIFLFTLIIPGIVFSQDNNYILDADTGNEMDDLYAIVQAIASPDMNLIALNSAQYNSSQIFMDSIWNGNKVTNFNSVTISQQYNEQILKGLNRMDIPHPIGCETHLGYAWGYYPDAHVPKSPATDFIIEQAKKASPDKKLKIICIGAVTNLAAAIETKPEIAKNIHAYILGIRYDPITEIWNKNDFNSRRDLNALDVLLDQTDLELTIMSVSIAKTFEFEKDETMKRLYAYNHTVTKLLADIWPGINAAKYRTMWDVTLLIALQKPELATLENRKPPPENKKDVVHVYTAIDTEAMRTHFWKTLDTYFNKH